MQSTRILRRFGIVAALLLSSAGVRAEPGVHWEHSSPAASARLQQVLDAYRAERHPTAVTIVIGDKIVAEAGDVSRAINLHSVRKSLLSTLYGWAVAEGRIKLDATLDELAIDDKPPELTADEKQAMVRDLLMARSGVYHQAAYETGEMKKTRPERGSHPHGTFWFYNNWDFNALGAIYRKGTGEDIFASFDKRIARPIGMENFSVAACRYVTEPVSRYPAYVFAMSAHDMARFGLLIEQHGRWGDWQIVSSAWLDEATKAYSSTGRGGEGYGYLWWVLPAADWGEGAILASGSGGQYIAIVPEMHLIATETVDVDHGAKRIHSRQFLAFLKQMVAEIR
jgi:CubicO group peptidase (beta-lactamase class C family)